MMPGRDAIRRPENCRWSVPAYRPNPFSDNDDDFESFWECERTTTDVRVTQHDCERCTHWSPKREHRPIKGRRR